MEEIQEQQLDSSLDAEINVEDAQLLHADSLQHHHIIHEEEVIAATAASSMQFDELDISAKSNEEPSEIVEKLDTNPKETRTFLQKIKSLISSSTILFAIFLTFVTHTCFGLHPIFSRYLQQVSQIPTLSLVSMCNLVVLVFYLPLHFIFVGCKFLYAAFILKEKRIPITKETIKSSLRQQWQWIYYVIITNYVLILFAIVLVLRSVTNFLSSRFTKAIYVQLIALGTPFMVSLLTLGLNFLVKRFTACQRFFKTTQFSNESLEWQTFVAICATCLGGILIIVGGKNSQQQSEQSFWSLNIDILGEIQSLTWMDYLGMFCSFFSSIMLAMYMILLKFAQSRDSSPQTHTSKTESTQQDLENQEPHSSSPEMSRSLTESQLFTVQVVVLGFSLLIPSLIFEDWSIWLRLQYSDWLMFLGMSFVIFYAANLCSIYSVRVLGATNVSTVFAWRLVSTILFSGIVLNEWFQSVWQIVGCGIVFFAITSFMLWKRHQSKKKENEKIQR